MLLTWESFGEDVRGVVIGIDIVVFDDPPGMKVAVCQCDHRAGPRYRVAVVAAILPPEMLLSKLYTQLQGLRWLQDLAFVIATTLRRHRL